MSDAPVFTQRKNFCVFLDLFPNFFCQILSANLEKIGIVITAKVWRGWGLNTCVSRLEHYAGLNCSIMARVHIFREQFSTNLDTFDF